MSCCRYSTWGTGWKFACVSWQTCL